MVDDGVQNQHASKNCYHTNKPHTRKCLGKNIFTATLARMSYVPTCISDSFLDIRTDIKNRLVLLLGQGHLLALLVQHNLQVAEEGC